MDLLLDTNVLLWAISTPERINAAARAALTSSEHRLVVSVASAWEIAIKHAIGKLPLPASPAKLVERALQDLDASILSITLDHTFAAATLPPHHKDPFDRMLIAQAQRETLVLVTADNAIREYGGATFWAG